MSSASNHKSAVFTVHGRINHFKRGMEYSGAAREAQFGSSSNRRARSASTAAYPQIASVP
jgi:hypothetical protein